MAETTARASLAGSPDSALAEPAHWLREAGAVLARRAGSRLKLDGCTVNTRNDVIIRDGEKELKIGLLHLW